MGSQATRDLYVFLAAGSLFGFTQIGEHLADLVWQLTFAVALACALPGTLENRRVALFAPIAVVGAYYAGSSSWHLMLVEGLVGLPLFCVEWGAIAATRSDTIRQRLMFEISSADADRIGAGGTELEPIYVFGEPLIYVIAGRTQAIAMNGWAPQINTRPLDVRRTRAHATVARLREREFRPLSRHIARRSYLGVDRSRVRHAEPNGRRHLVFAAGTTFTLGDRALSAEN